MSWTLWIWFMGFVSFLQHTHPSMAWYDNEAEWSFYHVQLRSTAHVRFPWPIERLLNNILDHPAHHLDPTIPLYNLPDSQKLLEEVAGAHGDSWSIHYAIGLIHLDWFTKLEHLPFAIASFEKCLALIRGRERESPHHVLVYRALGDAIVKGGNFAAGRKLWKDGETWFPDDRGLEKRLDLTALMVNRWIEDLRSWKTPQDTKLLSDILGDLGDLPSGSGASTVRSG